MSNHSENLHALTKMYHRNNIGDCPLENEIFDEIEILEKEEEHLRAANLLSIYINFAMYKFGALRVNSDRECVKLLIKHELVHVKKLDDKYILISKRTQSGYQNIYNYTIAEEFWTENGDFGAILADDTIISN